MGRNLIWAGVISLFMTMPTMGEERISLDEARALGIALISNRQPAAAREIALGLLQADSKDIDALLLLSRAERALGNTAPAVEAGRLAWSEVKTDADRFVVASVMAQAHASAENFTRAQFWLRRAAQAAPSEQLSALAARDFAVLRNANPLSFKLSFSAMPSDNVNNGNSNGTLTFAYLPGALANIEWEVPPDSRPLSGLAMTGQIELSYRVARTSRSQTNFNFDFASQTYVLSNQAKRTAPDVTAQSLGYQQASIGLSHAWLPEGASGPFSVDLSLSKSFYGGASYTRNVALTFGRLWQPVDGQTYSASITASQTAYLFDNSRTNGVTLRGAWQKTLANTDLLGMSISTSTHESLRPDRGYMAIGAQISYDFGDVGRAIQLAVAGSVETRVYDSSSFDPAGRYDVRTTIQANVGLPKFAVYGFTPVASISANQTNSSVPYFETEALRVGLNVKSTF